ncbi:MAG: transcriptional regulator [Massilibacillus sp.]|jgi:PAS domain S-box-containing protein|nr:transcriptional regulator [Massilibacillus sp.]
MCEKTTKNIALISTYPGMANVFVNLAEKHGCKPFVTLAEFDKAAKIAKEIEPRMDAILSRGGVTGYIKRAVKIPVVGVPITPFDVTLAINSVKNIPGEIAFFNFEQKLHGILGIEKIFNKKIYEYTFLNEQDIISGIQDAMSRNIKIVIGGTVAVREAQKYGLEATLVECGEEAIYRSLLEALHVIQVKHVETRRAARFKTMLDSISEGVLVTDEHNQIVVFNPAAERIFKMPIESVLGKTAESVIPNTRIHKVFAAGNAELNVLQKIHDGTIMTNRIPIFENNNPIGVLSTFEDVTKIQYLEQQIRTQTYAKGFIAKSTFANIETNDPQMEKLKELAYLYATTDTSVLIEGDSGTGKELFAQSIHNASKRNNNPFVAVNCSAIPENLLESELFGYESGSFTGAKKEGTHGLFEMAHKGTIFLDEIGEITPSMQVKLLRVLQEKEIRRVGGNKIIPVDIRVISATNKNLKYKVAQGEFRDDLYYRLNVFNLKIPPLNKRKEDIILLTRRFLQKFNVDADIDRVMEKLRPILLAYDWPGNVRELQNIMERLSLLTNRWIDCHWDEILQNALYLPTTEATNITIQIDTSKGFKQAVKQSEQAILNSLLSQHGYELGQLANFLGMGRTTLWRKLHGMDSQETVSNMKLIHPEKK